MSSSTISSPPVVESITHTIHQRDSNTIEITEETRLKTTRTSLLKGKLNFFTRGSKTSKNQRTNSTEGNVVAEPHHEMNRNTAFKSGIPTPSSSRKNSNESVPRDTKIRSAVQTQPRQHSEYIYNDEDEGDSEDEDEDEELQKEIQRVKQARRQERRQKKLAAAAAAAVLPTPPLSRNATGLHFSLEPESFEGRELTIRNNQGRGSAQGMRNTYDESIPRTTPFRSFTNSSTSSSSTTGSGVAAHTYRGVKCDSQARQVNGDVKMTTGGTAHMYEDVVALGQSKQINGNVGDLAPDFWN
ncbi:hypothetical protein BJ508DRAFT_416950 [Ascobolus immersus RN42]|uniref:Uncharacterized protein n=1 Tax=Ascobolus immersus RN42 TaxID=1160509 RepID=A0A3N4I0T2_ASCIM|nr:hypothetical protein BJ508DRAFT_416950 [Ascobolus immersus RN42]